MLTLKSSSGLFKTRFKYKLANEVSRGLGNKFPSGIHKGGALVLIIGLFSALLTACAIKPETGESFAMDTVITQVTYSGDAISSNNALIRDIENSMSKTLEGSDIYRINHAAPDEGVEVSPETAMVISACLDEAERTNGVFNPALCGVVDLWDFNGGDAAVPDPAELERALGKVDYTAISVEGETVFAHGQKLDLGGAVKGYALGAIADNLNKEGATALVSLGGSVCTAGEKPGGGWVVGIRNPGEGAQSYMAAFEPDGLFVSTSGVYERGFYEDGEYYHHIIDPATGYPVKNGLLSVTVAADNGIISDIYSTALFVMGVEEGLAFAEENGVEAVFITDGNEVYATPGMAYLEFEIKDSDYNAAQ